jgi:hypothetical protein
MNRKQKRLAAVLSVILIALAFGFASGMIPFSAIGGFQGLTVANQGMQIGSSQKFVPIGTSIPNQGSTTLKWNSGSCFTINGFEVLGVGTANDEICVSLGNTNAALICTSSLLGIGNGATCPQLSYSKLTNVITNSSGTFNTWQTVTAEVQEYNITQTFAVQVPSYNLGGYQSTAGYSINWLTSLSNFVWNEAYSGQSNLDWQGNLYMSPLFMVIGTCLESVTASNPGQGIANSQCSNIYDIAHDTIIPKGQGYSVPLSSSMSFASSIPSNGFSTNCISSKCISQIKSTLQSSANAYSPSSLFVDLTNTPVYYQISLTDLGPYACGALSLYTCAPVITLNYDLYTLTAGTFISHSANPSQIIVKPPATSSCPAGQNAILGVCVNLATSGNWLIVILVFIVIIAVIVVVVPRVFSKKGSSV